MTTPLAAHCGNVAPNMGRPLFDSVFVASSCTTSECSARRPPSMRRMSTTIRVGLRRRSIPRYTHEDSCLPPRARYALLVEERHQGRNHLIGRCLHQPVARPLHHDTLDVVVDEAALFDEEFPPRLLAAQHEHRHGERRLSQLRPLLPVPLERAKPLHASPDVPRSSVRRRVEAAITLGDRMRWIGGEVVPEVLQIDSLSTHDQRPPRFAIKMAE